MGSGPGLQISPQQALQNGLSFMQPGGHQITPDEFKWIMTNNSNSHYGAPPQMPTTQPFPPFGGGASSSLSPMLAQIAALKSGAGWSMPQMQNVGMGSGLLGNAPVPSQAAQTPQYTNAAGNPIPAYDPFFDMSMSAGQRLIEAMKTPTYNPNIPRSQL